MCVELAVVAFLIALFLDKFAACLMARYIIYLASGPTWTRVAAAAGAVGFTIQYLRSAPTIFSDLAKCTRPAHAAVYAAFAATGNPSWMLGDVLLGAGAGLGFRCKV